MDKNTIVKMIKKAKLSYDYDETCNLFTVGGDSNKLKTLAKDLTANGLICDNEQIGQDPSKYTSYGGIMIAYCEGFIILPGNKVQMNSFTSNLNQVVESMIVIEKAEV